VRPPLKTLATGGVLAALVAVFGVYPACLRRSAESRVRAEGCNGNRPPGDGFYRAVRDDERAAGFPGFGPSDVVAAEAVFCVGTYAQACLAIEGADESAKRATCERWRPFARWYHGLRPDAADVCSVCTSLP
jgi:hypothetical protein